MYSQPSELQTAATAAENHGEEKNSTDMAVEQKQF